MELVIIDFKDKQFTANGKIYLIEHEVSIQRAVYAQAAKQQIQTASTAGKQSSDWKKVYELANQSKFADIVILAHNNMNAITRLYEEVDPVIKLCCCYFNTVNEDRRIITDEMVQQKVNDFALGGIAHSNFFAFALALLKAEVESSNSGMEELLAVIKNFNQERLNMKQTG